MTKLITTILFSFIATSSFSQTTQTGFYFLAEKPSDGLLVNDLDSENVFAIEKTPILSKEDFKKVKIVTLDFEPENIKAIKIQLSSEARKTWRDAKKRILKTGESIVFVYNDKVYHSQTMYGNAKTPDSYVNLIVHEKYIGEIFKELK